FSSENEIMFDRFEANKNPGTYLTALQDFFLNHNTKKYGSDKHMSFHNPLDYKAFIQTQDPYKLYPLVKENPVNVPLTIPVKDKMVTFDMPLPQADKLNTNQYSIDAYYQRIKEEQIHTKV